MMEARSRICSQIGRRFALSPFDFRLSTFQTGLWLMAVALFAFSLVLNTRHNDFPYTYHPDERGKVLQIIEQTRNFHHPLLLLTATDWVVRLGGIERTPQSVVQAGRWVSAAFAAGTVVALALIAWLVYGTLAGWAAGLVMAFQVDLFKTAHYMKEDPALVFGLSLSLLAAHWWWRAPNRRTLRFFGFACGLATAAKYLGVVTLFFAVPLIVRRSFPNGVGGSRARLKSFAAVFALTFLILNVPFPVREVSSPFRSVHNEMGGVTGGHRGLTRHVPHGVYFEKLHRSTPVAIGILAAAYALALCLTARRRSAVEWVTLLFPIGFVAMLSCSPKIADRYLVPVNVTLAFLGVLGAAEIARLVGGSTSAGQDGWTGWTGWTGAGWKPAPHPTGTPQSRVRIAVATAALACGAGLLIFAELPTYRVALEEYGTDDHAIFAAWVAVHLPAEAVIAEDHRVNLSAVKSDGVSADKRVPQTVLDEDFAADLGTLGQLRIEGVTHVAVCRESYDRFFDKAVKPGKEERADYERRKTFYTELFAGSELVHELPPGKIFYLHPGIKLYRLPAADPPATIHPSKNLMDL